MNANVILLHITPTSNAQQEFYKPVTFISGKKKKKQKMGRDAALFSFKQKKNLAGKERYAHSKINSKSKGLVTT